jgi:hypothetical protein
MKKTVIVIVASLIGFWSSPVLSGDITCWDRSISSVVSAFGSREVAESWYPEYVYITDEEVQWGDASDSWYKPLKNNGDSYKKAQSSEQGTLFKFNYNGGRNTLTVIKVAAPGYRAVNPIIYKQCDHNK